MAESTNMLSNKIAIGLLLIAVVGCSLLIYSMPLNDVLNQSQQIKSWLAVTGYAAPVVFTLAAALLTAIGMPRLLLCSLAGGNVRLYLGFCLESFWDIARSLWDFHFCSLEWS